MGRIDDYLYLDVLDATEQFVLTIPNLATYRTDAKVITGPHERDWDHDEFVVGQELIVNAIDSTAYSDSLINAHTFLYNHDEFLTTETIPAFAVTSVSVVSSYAERDTLNDGTSIQEGDVVIVDDSTISNSYILDSTNVFQEMGSNSGIVSHELKFDHDLLYHNQLLDTTNDVKFSQIEIQSTPSLLVPYTFAEELSTFDLTGAINLGYYDDDNEWQHNLPFLFEFFGKKWNLVTLSSNGFLYLGYETSNSSPNSVDDNKSGPFICPHGTDLVVDPDSSRLNIINAGTGYTDGTYFVDGTNARSGARILGNTTEIRVLGGIVTYARWFFGDPVQLDGLDWISGDSFIINDVDIGGGAGASFTVRCIPTIGIWEKIETDGIIYYWIANEYDAGNLYVEYVEFAIKLYKNGDIRLSYGNRTTLSYNNVIVGINDDNGNYLAGALDALILQPPGYDNDQIFTYLNKTYAGSFDKDISINGDVMLNEGSSIYLGLNPIPLYKRTKDNQTISVDSIDGVPTILILPNKVTNMNYIDLYINGSKMSDFHGDYSFVSGDVSPYSRIETNIKLFVNDNIEIITWELT